MAMKAIKNIAAYICITIALTPCLLILNEQPEDVPQKWWINIIGLAYAGVLSLVCRRKDNSNREEGF
jgi:hypothetical protein